MNNPSESSFATLAQRVFWSAVADDGRFARLLEMLQAHRPAVDEVWLFTESDGQDFRFIPLPQVERRAAILAGRIQALRAAGFGASINVLNTIGHSDYAEPFLDPLPWSGVVGPDGAMSSCCSCPRQPGFREYVVAKYTAYARGRPDWIWVDDDVRLFGHFWKVMHGCFCPVCLAEFSRRVGTQWDRAGLYAAIVRNTYPAANAERRAWMQYLSDQIVEIHRLICATVQAVDPRIGLGGMNTGFHWHTAYYAQFAERYDALRARPATVVRARPGGGAFTDDRPVEGYQKAWSIAFQNAQYPPATERHAEVENYPFQFFEKSVAATVREASLYLATGCEGVAFDILGSLGNDPFEHAPYLAGVAAQRPYLDEIRRTLVGARPLGLVVAFHPEHAALAPSDGQALESTDANQFFAACGWGFLGIPLCFRREPDAPCLLHGQLAKGLPRETLAAILPHGAVMDGEALAHLWNIGLGPAVGARVAARYETGTFERFTDHPLNAGFAGYTREVSQGYYPGTASVFEAAGATLQPLARLENYRAEDLGICSATIEHPSGGRFALIGYRPWDYVGLPGKRAQCRHVVDWLHQGQFPLRLATGGKAVLFAHALATGGVAACLYNASADPLVAPVLRGQRAGERADVLYPDSARQSVGASATGEIVLPDLPPWGECFIRWRK